MAQANNSGQSGASGDGTTPDNNNQGSGSGPTGATGPNGNSGSNGSGASGASGITGTSADDQTPSTTQAQHTPDKAKENKQIAANRAKEIDARDDLSDDEKAVLKLYDQGMQNFAIALKVFKFVNQDTVGKVVLIIRKEHADDWDEVENVNSTKGYTGVGVGA